MPSLRTALLLLVLVLLALCACGRDSATEPNQVATSGTGAKTLPPSAPSLPGLAELRRILPGGSRSSSYIQADLERKGKDFDAGLLNNEVLADGDTLNFSPPDGANEPGPQHYSYAGYSFNVGDYGGAGNLYFDFVGNEIQTDDYFCLANWDTGRWDSFAFGDPEPQQVGAIDPYVNDSGALALYVLVIGGGARLNSVRLGSQLPAAQLVANPPLIGVGSPQTVDMDASGSIDPDGEIVEYRWDPEGDGSFDASSGSDPHFSANLELGSFTPAVRVYDDTGGYGEASAAITLKDGGILSCGVPDDTMTTCAAVPLGDGSVLIFGDCVQQPQGHLQAMELRVYPDGSLGQAILQDQFTTYIDAVLASDGFIYACGRDLETGDCFVQQIALDASINWSKSLSPGAGDNIIPTALAFDAGSLYLVGEHSTGGPSDSVTARLGTDGSVQWAKTLANSSLVDVQAQTPFQLNDPAVYCCGQSAGQSFYCTFTQLGVLKSSKTNPQGGATALLLDGVGPTVYLLQTANVTLNNQQGFRLAKLSGEFTTYVLPLNVTSFPDDLMSYGPGQIAILALQQTSITPELPESPVLALVNTDFSIPVPAARLDAQLSTINHLGGFFRFDSTHIGLCGYTHGSLPAEEAIDLSSESGTAAWSDVVMASTDLDITVADLDLHPANIGGETFNREPQTGNDYDALLWLTPR